MTTIGPRGASAVVAVSGDPEPRSQTRSSVSGLFSTLYHTLHRLARARLSRAGRGVTLGATTLLHETYLKLEGRPLQCFPDEESFVAYAARTMRSIVLDHVRGRSAQKRSLHLASPFDEDVVSIAEQLDASGDLDALDAALSELEQRAAPLAQLVELRYFSGLKLAEIAALRGVSERTVRRDWHKARELLRRGLGSGRGPAASP